MTTHLERLAKRRQQLIAESGAQRSALASSLEPWRTPLALVDHGLAGLRFLGRHPVWLIGGLALLVWHPAFAGNWLRRGWLVWRVVQSVRRR